MNVVMTSRGPASSRCRAPPRAAPFTPGRARRAARRWPRRASTRSSPSSRRWWPSRPARPVVRRRDAGLLLATGNAHKVDEVQAILGAGPDEVDARDPGRRGDRRHLRGERPAQGPARWRRPPASWRSPTTRASRSTTSAARPGVHSARWTDEGDWIPRVLRELDGVAGGGAGLPLRVRRRGRVWPGRPGGRRPGRWSRARVADAPAGHRRLRLRPDRGPDRGRRPHLRRDDRRREARHQPPGAGRSGPSGSCCAGILDRWRRRPRPPTGSCPPPPRWRPGSSACGSTAWPPATGSTSSRCSRTGASTWWRWATTWCSRVPPPGRRHCGSRGAR